MKDPHCLGSADLLLAAALLLAATPLSAQQSAAAPASPPFDVQRIADGVHVLVRTDPPGLMFEANAAFIVNDEDVVVIDGGSNPASAQAVLAAIRRTTPKPVRFVINTHWHDDHMMGNMVFRDTFPAVEFIAHATAGEDLATDGARNRRQMVEQGPQMAAFLRDRVAQGRSLDDSALSDEERASHLSSLRLAEHFFAQAPGFRPIAPTMALERRLTLRRGGRTIDVHWLGRAHTRGDLVVHLPEDGIVFAGDLVSWPIPLIGSTSFPLEYGATLEKVLALPHAMIVPGHGPVLRDDAYVSLMIRLLAAIRSGTQAAVARGETLEQARKSIDLGALRREFAGDSPVRALLFDNYVAGPAVARAFQAASSGR